jgi:hypothetical protein
VIAHVVKEGMIENNDKDKGGGGGEDKCKSINGPDKLNRSLEGGMVKD